MESYITAFSVYTLAIIGVIFIGLVVVKKTLSFKPGQGKNNFLKVETSLDLGPGKTIYVIKAGKEKFLIASSGENCRFMTKLEKNETAYGGFKGHPQSDNHEIIREYFDYGRIN